MPTNENEMIHVRTTTKAEVEKKVTYVALGIQYDPIGSFKTIIDCKQSVVPTETD